MRVLYLGRADEFSDVSSLALVPKQMFQRLQMLDPQLYVTWVVPGSTPDEVLEQYLLRDMPDPARLGFVKTSARKLGRMIGYFLTNEIWDLLSQTKVKVPYDVVLNQHFGTTPLLQTLLTNKYKASRFNVAVPLVNWHVWTLVRKQLETMPEYYAGEADLAAESLSALFGFRNIWESDFLYDEHVKTLRGYVTPAVVQEVKAKSMVVPAGIATKKLDDVFEARKLRIFGTEGGAEKPTLFWGGRFSGVKRIRTTFPLMDRVSSRTGAPVVVSTSDTGSKVASATMNYSTWQIFEGQGKDGFFRVMGLGDVFLCNGVSEGYGTAWLEMLAAGMLGVFERKWWVEALLPPWYPFVADSEEEQVMFATALVADFPEGPLWMEYVPRVRDWIRAEHDEGDSARRLWGVLQEAYQWGLDVDSRLGRGTVADLIRGATEGFSEIDEAELYARMMQDSTAAREFGTSGDVMSRMYLRRVMEAMGWRDTCQGPEVVFVR